MKIKIFLFVFALSLTAFFFPGPPLAFCEEANLAVNELIQTGESFYEQGQYARAIDELSKALLLEPNNQEAKRYLNMMGIKEGLYGGAKTPLSQVEEMVSDIDGYQKKVSDLEAQNSQKEKQKQLLEQGKETLEKTVQEKEEEKAALLEKTKQVEQESAAQVQRAREALGEVDKRGKEIIRLNTDLYDMKSRLVSQGALSKEQQARLEQEEQEFKRHKKLTSRQEREMKIAYEQKLWDREKAAVSYQRQAETLGRQQRQRIGNLEDALSQQIQDAGSTHDRLIFTEYQLADSESELAAKDKRIRELKVSLTEMEDNLALVESKFRSSPGASVANVPVGQAQRAAVQEEVAQSVQFLKNQDKMIADLKEKLAVSRQQISALKAGEKQVGGEETLKKQLEDVSGQLQQTKQMYEQKSSDYTEMEGRLKDIQERLRIVEGLMQEKDEQLKDLEKQLNDALVPSSEQKKP